MMPGPHPHSLVHAMIPRHNSRGRQHGAANRDLPASRPQLRGSAPPPSPSLPWTPLPASPPLLFIVFPLLAAGTWSGGSRLGTALEGRGQRDKGPHPSLMPQPYCILQTLPAAHPCWIWGACSHAAYARKGTTPSCLRNLLLRAFPHHPLDPRPPLVSGSQIPNKHQVLT